MKPEYLVRVLTVNSLPLKSQETISLSNVSDDPGTNSFSSPLHLDILWDLFSYLSGEYQRCFSRGEKAAEVSGTKLENQGELTSTFPYGT
jgi:hypothetical protein